MDLSPLTPIACPFRQQIRHEADRETAACGLAARLLNIDAQRDHAAAQCVRVDRSACEHCFADGSERLDRVGDVISSIILSATENADRSSQMGRIRKLADTAIGLCSRESPALQNSETVTCDAIFVVDACDSLASIERSMASWLSQDQGLTIIHLIGGTEHTNPILDHFAHHPYIRLHRFSNLAAESKFRPRRSWIGRTMAALQCIVGALETPFVAIASPTAEMDSRHLVRAITSLRQNGAEIYVGSVNVNGNMIGSRKIKLDAPARSFNTCTLVFRRATFVDMGGMSDCDEVADIEWLHRAGAEGRLANIDTAIAANIQGYAPQGIVDLRRANEVPIYHDNEDSLESFAMGFPDISVPCDVVLPFRGQLNYVSEAIESILAQQYANFTLHLIDDATEVSESEFQQWLAPYRNEPRIRIYRNRENIGQFSSVNRVVSHLTSDWIVTHDGDDRSLPNRLGRSIQRAELTRCDLFAAATELFGPEQLILRMAMSRRHLEQPPRRYSRYPVTDENWYFLENPTIVHHREFFLRMNGFADFGTVTRNRTSIDTEYMLRAHFAGAHIAISRWPMIQYRVHPEAATQHSNTRMGSPIRNWCQEQLLQRLQIFKSGRFDPRVFGSLSRCTPAQRSPE